MQPIYNATLECSDETAGLYEFSIGPDDPISFPLTGCFIVHNGSRATISIPMKDKPNHVIDRLTGVAEPKKPGGKAKKQSMALSGTSEMLQRIGIAPEDAIVSFVITEGVCQGC